MRLRFAAALLLGFATASSIPAQTEKSSRESTPASPRLPGGVAGKPYNESLAGLQPAWSGWRATSEIPGLQVEALGRVSGTPAREGLYFFLFTALDERKRPQRMQVLLGISGELGQAKEQNRNSRRRSAVDECKTLQAGVYELRRNIGSDESSVCLRLASGHVDLDLGGHTVRGRIVGKAIDLNGIEIAHGTLECNFADTDTDHGCLQLTGEQAAKTPLRVHDLTLRQLSNTGTGAARALHIDWSARTSGLPVTEPAVQITSVTASVGPSKGDRSPILNVQGSAITVEAAHNVLTCPTGSNACQGIVCYGVHACWVHANRIVLEPNPMIDETARAILFDQVKDRPDAFGEAWNNDVVANEGRAVRVRSSYNVWVHDNSVEPIANPAPNPHYIAAIHLGDPDSGTDDLKDTRVFRNFFQLGRGGTVIFARNTRDVLVENNVVLCSGCADATFAAVRNPLNPGEVSGLTLRNNIGRGIALSTWVEQSATLRICNSGATTGEGKVERSPDCAPR